MEVEKLLCNDGKPLFSEAHKLNLRDPEVYRRAMAIYDGEFEIKYIIDLANPMAKPAISVYSNGEPVRQYEQDEWRKLSVK